MDRCLPVPIRGSNAIYPYAFSEFVHVSEEELSMRTALGRSQTEPAQRLGKVVLYAVKKIIRSPEERLRGRIAF